MEKDWSGSLAMKPATEGKPLMKFLEAWPNSRSGSGFEHGAWDFQRLRRISEIRGVVAAWVNEDILRSCTRRGWMVGHQRPTRRIECQHILLVICDAKNISAAFLERSSISKKATGVKHTQRALKSRHIPLRVCNIFKLLQGSQFFWSGHLPAPTHMIVFYT